MHILVAEKLFSLLGQRIFEKRSVMTDKLITCSLAKTFPWPAKAPNQKTQKNQKANFQSSQKSKLYTFQIKSKI